MNRPTPQSAAERDQYFTSPEAVELCLDAFLPIVRQVWGDPAQGWFVEPSAGDGAFLQALKGLGLNTWGGDIEPQHPSILRHDVLAQPLPKPPG